MLIRCIVKRGSQGIRIRITAPRDISRISGFNMVYQANEMWH